MEQHWHRTWGVAGHDWAVEQLRRSLRHGRSRQAYLFIGPESVGKETLARGFAMALMCQQADEADRPCGVCDGCQRILHGSHIDILTPQYDPTTGSLKIEEVRALAGRLARTPYEARCRVAIVPHFDRAQPIAQDALLKTLEEPAPHAVLILLAEDAGRLLPTILSRCQVLQLRPASASAVGRVLVEQAGLEKDQAAVLAQLSGGRIGWALRMAQDGSLLAGRAESLEQLRALLGQSRAERFAVAEALSKDKSVLTDTLELWQTFWRDVLLANEQAEVPVANADFVEYVGLLASYITPEQALRALKSTRDTLATVRGTNANARLALEVMLLDYPGL